MFASLTRHHHLAGGGVEVACDGPGIAAAALWDPPNRWKHSPREELAMLPSIIRAFGYRAGVARYVIELMKRHHPEEPHWYLAVIGSDTVIQWRAHTVADVASSEVAKAKPTTGSINRDTVGPCDFTERPRLSLAARSDSVAPSRGR
jgi:hypothetical protein